MIEVLFIRHGATVGNLEHRYIGRTDEPLCPEGIAQLEALERRHLHADILFVSPMRRTRQTAALLFPAQEQTVMTDFRETDFGDFEGKTAAELADNAAYAAWLDTLCKGAIPHGESVAAFKARCCAAFAEAMAGVKDGATVALVTHGGIIMAILEEYARPKRDFYSYHIGNGEMIVAAYEYSKDSERVTIVLEGSCSLIKSGM
ncbi:MAG: histidine phosphatase family protein [Eubacteriales bacterium]|nr:histidine phosphatase family protein [Eubacteriales bacterium]